ncbi:MAG TPA: hypothetical protein DD621_00500 [Clostridiales bacterium]|nr:hypothetical protein [Clostridiales bacterium]
MLSLLNNTNFFSKYGLLIVLVVALVVLMFISFNRRKKEDTYRNELLKKVIPGARIKTYYGLYGKVLKITETTDGKILLIETGEDKKVSYMNIHINAVYGIDEKEEVTLDENGLPVDTEKKETKSESEKKFEELEKQLAEKEKESESKEEVKEEVVEPVVESPAEEKVETVDNKPKTTKSTKSTKTSSTKKTTAKKETK